MSISGDLLKYEGCSEFNASHFIVLSTVSEADAGNTAVKVELLTSILFHFVAVQQIAGKGQSDTMLSKMEVCMKQ